MAIDHFLASSDFPLSHLDRLPRDLLQRIDIVEVNIFDIVHGRVHISRHGQIDNKQRALLMTLHDRLQLFTSHDGMGRRCRANENIDLIERRVPVIKMHREAADLIGQGSSAVERAIRNDHRSHAPRDKAPRDPLARIACTEKHHFSSAQIAEYFSGEVDSHGAHRSRSACDLGFAPHLLGDTKGILKKFIQVDIRCPKFKGRIIGLLDLTEDLGLANDHRIQPTRDAKKMPDAQMRIVRVKWGLRATRPLIDEASHSLHHPQRADTSCIEFHSIAGRNNHCAKKAIDRAQLRQGFLKIVAANSKFLTHLDGRIVMIDASAKDRHFGFERCWMTGSVTKMKIKTPTDRIAVRLGAMVWIPRKRTINA